MDESFLYDDSELAEFVSEHILDYLPVGERTLGEKRIYDLLDAYRGREGDVLCVLANAARQGRFERFYLGLSDFYQECFSSLPTSLAFVVLGGSPLVEERFGYENQELELG
jgi:hypothetical protein